MFQHTLHRGLFLKSKKKLFIPSSPKCTHTVIKSSLTFSGAVPADITPFGVKLSTVLNTFRINVLRNAQRNIDQSSSAICRKSSDVLAKKNITYKKDIRKCNWENVWCIFRGNYRKSLQETKCIPRIALASALFVPSTIFKASEIKKEEKSLPIDIPQEIKKPKRKDALKSFILSTYNLIRLILRALRLLVTFTPIFCIYPVTYLGERPKDFWWGLLLKAIEFSGPIVIKLGQWISTRRDLFPDTCCTQFAHLQRRIPPHSWSFTVYRMRKAFGPNWRRVFVKFDNNRNPIGSGCVAQVYKVWMSKDAIPDEELLAEMISELDDENTNTAFEGLEIQGFKKFFGFDDEEDKVQEQAITDWRKNRDEMRLRKEDIEAGVQLHPESDLVTGGISKEDIQPSNESQKSEIADTEMEVLEHSLVEVWEEADLDKSLPVEDAPPEDLDGLIPVAVKILHPSVHSYFRRDLKILQACAIFITALYPPLKWLSLPQCVNEFAEVMSGQINLRKEADNLELFTENFADIPSIRFPRPLRPYVTQKVMVETFEDGAGMGDFIGSSGGDKPNELKIHLAQIGVDALLKMVFLDNFVHGDLHPGNMLIQNINLTKDGNLANTGDITRIMMVDVGCDTFVMDVKPDPNPMRICLLDCGVVAKLREQDLVNFKAVFKQVVLGDGRSVADLFLENSEHKCKNPEAFKAEMTELVATARQDTISLAQVDVGVLLQQVLGILLRHEVRLESAFSSVVLAVFVLEGLGRALDPNMDILERARPMLVDAAIH